MLYIISAHDESWEKNIDVESVFFTPRLIMRKLFPFSFHELKGLQKRLSFSLIV